MAGRYCPYCMQEIEDPNASYCAFCGNNLNIVSSTECLPIGFQITDPYTGFVYVIGKALGAGGFGITYIAKSITEKRIVAIKEYFPSRCNPQRLPDGSIRIDSRFYNVYENGKDSFLLEASMLVSLENMPSIVRGLSFFQANNTMYFVMEYLYGKTLKTAMESNQSFLPEKLIGTMLPLIHDLGELHDMDIIHRDIAPDNIMLMPNHKLKLFDFGCARSMEDGKSMTVIFKEGFAPIEQMQSRGQGTYTDIYAICATIYYCLTGCIPPSAVDRLSAAMDDLPDPLLPPTELGVSLTPEQEQVLLKGMALQVPDRTQSMHALEDDLKEAFFGEKKEIPRVEADIPKNEDLPEEPDTDFVNILIWGFMIGLMIYNTIAIFSRWIDLIT